VATTLTVSDGAIAQTRIALTGVGPTALRAPAAEALLVGHALEPKLTSRAVEAVRAAIAPDTDLHASADYRRHLAGALTRRALVAAWRRANESAA
jgi:carbon-monoxide dehydrogenase medium subunit